MDEKSLLQLHTLLGFFEAYMARKQEPPNWDCDECEQARFLQQCIEDIVRGRQI